MQSIRAGAEDFCKYFIGAFTAEGNGKASYMVGAHTMARRVLDTCQDFLGADSQVVQVLFKTGIAGNPYNAG